MKKILFQNKRKIYDIDEENNNLSIIHENKKR
jgi:hypothetical protein